MNNEIQKLHGVLFFFSDYIFKIGILFTMYMEFYAQTTTLQLVAGNKIVTKISKRNTYATNYN